MFASVSRRGRTIIGRLETGDDLLEGLTALCRKYSVRTAEVRAIGAFQEVQLTAYDQRHKRYGPTRTFRGNLEIVSLSGNVTEKDGDIFLHLHAIVARDTDNGVEVLGGHLLGGKVFALECVLNTCDDLILRRLEDKETGLWLWNDVIELPEDAGFGTAPPKSEGETGQVEDSQPTWRDVLSEAMVDRAAPTTQDQGTGGSGRNEARPNEQILSSNEQPGLPAGSEDTQETDGTSPEAVQEEWAEPEVGDILVHPKFGRCVIQKIEEGHFLHARIPSRRLVRLSLDILELRLVGYEKGHQVFEAKILQD